MSKHEPVWRFSIVDWASVPTERVGEGIERQMVWGERVMVCRLRLAPHTVTPVHSHPHEQITLVEQGPVEFFVDGQKRIANTGDVLHFPSNSGMARRCSTTKWC